MSRISDYSCAGFFEGSGSFYRLSSGRVRGQKHMLSVILICFIRGAFTFAFWPHLSFEITQFSSGRLEGENKQRLLGEARLKKKKCAFGKGHLPE